MTTRSRAIAAETAAYLQHQRAIEIEFQKLVHRLDFYTDKLELIGERDMGVLHRRIASRYHTATARLRALVRELQQDVMWPHEVNE